MRSDGTWVPLSEKSSHRDAGRKVLSDFEKRIPKRKDLWYDDKRVIFQLAEPAERRERHMRRHIGLALLTAALSVLLTGCLFRSTADL